MCVDMSIKNKVIWGKIMRIGIITIYESITNMGSFLQAYALKTVLEDLGHEVYLIQNTPASEWIKKYVCKINPKREFFLRLKKAKHFLDDLTMLKLLPKDKISEAKLDMLIYGSDEIWNLENPYFRENIFWGLGKNTIKKVAYAISIGAMTCDTEKKYNYYLENLSSFAQILVRDKVTKQFVERNVKMSPKLVCDPTILTPVQKINRECKKYPKEKYLLVYTYGVDSWLEKQIVRFARKNNLLILSPCFWHYWADKVIECSALELGSLMAHAEYVVTTTFHGAIFSLLNHTKCCIYPTREKVTDVVYRLGEEHRLINEHCKDEEFDKIINMPFDSLEFENRIEERRKESLALLEEALLK